MKILDNIKRNAIFLLIVSTIVLVIVLHDDMKSIITAFQNIDYKYIIIAVLFYFLSIAIKGYVNYLIVNDKEKISIKEAIKHNFIAQFFNGVTPFSTGGQPMEIYMLTEHNISATKATNLTIQSFIFYQLALVICGIIAVGYNFYFHIFPKVIFLEHLVLLGFIINVLVVIILLFSSSKKVVKTMYNIILKVASIFKIKTNEDKLNSIFKEFSAGMSILKKRKNLAIIGILLNIISLVCLYIIPLFVFFSLGDFHSLSIIDTLTASAYVYLIGSFVPIPGASGGIEYGFTQFYGNFIGLEVISASLLIWRFITYYLGMIIGALLFSLEKKVKK